MLIFYYHFQLKVQEAMRKKEKFQREHEEVSKYALKKTMFLFLLHKFKTFLNNYLNCLKKNMNE